MIKDKKVKVNKQKLSNACPAELMLIAIKCLLIQSCPNNAKPNVEPTPSVKILEKR